MFALSLLIHVSLVILIMFGVRALAAMVIRSTMLIFVIVINFVLPIFTVAIFADGLATPHAMKH